jgi:hypothetical protein
LLDYAANGVAYWQPGRIAEAFEATCATLGKNPEDTLSAFLNGQTPEEFWSQVDANFDAGRVKLVFVADVVPPELARVVEFLNEQMRADVRAVELNWFEGAGNATTLVPRVIGETQRAVAQKTARSAFVPVAVDDWIDTRLERHGDQASAAARAFVEMIESLGGRVEASKGSIIAVFEGQDGKAVYPMHLWESGKVSPSFEYLWKRPGLANELVRRKYYEEFAQIAGPLSTTNLKGTPGFPLVRLADPAVRTALRPVMERFFQAATVA